MTTIIDFNDLSSGTIVDDEYSADGVTISASGGSGRAMIFDTSNPTGGDGDLATDTLGNVLIISEDGDSSDPDDNAGGGTFTFAFDSASTVASLTVLDVEESGYITLYDEHHNVIGTVDLPVTGNNGQAVVPINVAGVAFMDVTLCGSGAIDNLVFETPADDMAPNFIVEGTDGDDLIDAAYDQDPEGDFIDALDNDLTPPSNDDVVEAGAGNDTVKAGDGDDTVFGGTGNDFILGDDNNAQDGDDLLFGEGGNDTLCGLDGDDTLDGGAGNDLLEGMGDSDLLLAGSGNDRAYGDGGNDTIFGDEGSESSQPGDDTLVGGAGDDLIYGNEGDDLIDGNSGADTLFGDDPAQGTVVSGNLIFNGSFEITSGMTTTGYGFRSDDGVAPGWTDANGEEIDFHNDGRGGIDASDGENWLDLEASPGNARVGQDVAGIQDGETYRLTFDAGDKADEPQSGPGENLVEVYWGGELVATVDPSAGQMTEFTFDLIGGAGDGSNRLEFAGTGDLDNFGASVDDVRLVQLAGAPGVGGDDTISGGTGADVIDGQDGDDDLSGDQGDDLLIGGAGMDTISGGADRDTIVGGNDGDVVDGGTGSTASGDVDDVDVLDLTGEGPFEVVNETDDADGNSTSGTINFLDDDGNVTGSMTFTEIEEILGDRVVNEDPVAVDDVVPVDEDGSATFNPLANDTDADGDTPSITDISDPANGTLTDNGDGTYTYTPDPDFNGTDAVTYTIDDGNGGTDTATITFNVDAVNDAPVAGDDSNSTDFETAVQINLLANDSDIDGDALSVISASVDPAQGSISEVSSGVYTFTPADGFEGTATVSYTIADGNGGTDNAVHTIDVGADPTPQDGAVDGEETGEVMGPNYDDAEQETDGGGDIIDGPDGDDDSIRGNGGDDTINAGAGNDTVDGGADNDVVNGGTGNDIVSGGDGDDLVTGGFGDDTVLGGEGNDTLRGNIGDDSLDGGDGNDSMGGAEGNDTLLGGAGEDTLTGGSGDDVLDGGLDNDTINGSSGNDTITDLDGDNLIESGIDGLPDRGFPFVGNADPVTDDDLDSVTTGDGNDTINTGDDNDTIDAGNGDNVIDAGFDDDLVTTGSGNDAITLGEGSDTVNAGGGDDTIFGGIGTDAANLIDENVNPANNDDILDNGDDLINAGDGNDLVFGEDDNDTIDGGTGNDTLDGGIDDDTILGGDGNDVITGGQGADSLDGGLGNDTFNVGTFTDPIFGDDYVEGIGDTIVGGEDEDDGDIDTLDLTGAGSLEVVFDDAVDPTGTPGESGTVIFYTDDTQTTVAGTLEFREIENVIPCFTPGAMIATPRGEVSVETLRIGDKVITRDNGIQEIRWTGNRTLTRSELAEGDNLKPILIKAGSLGQNLPERDMLVSPQHRVLVTGEAPQLYFEESEVLVAAKHLVGRTGVRVMDTMRTTYIHFMFDRHEVVLSDGAWTESFQPGDQTLGAMGQDSRDEIFALFPELTTQGGLTDYAAARRSLKAHEAKLLQL